MSLFKLGKKTDAPMAIRYDQPSFCIEFLIVKNPLITIGIKFNG